MNLHRKGEKQDLSSKFGEVEQDEEKEKGLNKKKLANSVKTIKSLKIK